MAGVPLCPALAQDQFRDIPLKELTSHPIRYEGDKVRIKGFLVIRFENHAIYPSRDHLDRKRALWIGSPVDLVNRNRELAGQDVIVEGIFDPKSHGHLGNFGGAIVVSKIDPSSNESSQSPGNEGVSRNHP